MANIDGNNGSNDVAESTDLPNSENVGEQHEPTLAELVAENEHALYMKSREHQQAIEDEIRENTKLCGPKLPIDALVENYDPEHSAEYFSKAMDLANTYSHIRYIRGDGNCFFRAMVTAILERCVIDEEELQRVNKVIEDWAARLHTFGFPESTTTDFYEAFRIILDSVASNKSLEFLYDDLNNENVANYYVAFARIIASAYLRENEAEYVGFVEGGRSMEQYCRDDIEPMWRECDHLGVIALTNAFQTPIRIEYMDRTHAPSGGWHHDIGISEENADRPINIFFLYRPSHYDILYRR